MILNISLEAVVGMIPLVGDIFDAFYKSNIRNLELLERHLLVVEPEISQAREPVMPDLLSQSTTQTNQTIITN